MNRRHLGWVVLLAAALAAPVSAQDGQGSIERILDEPFSIKLEDTAITAALGEISARTKVNIALAEGTLARLPHGEETRLRINARDVKLRDALDAVLTPMALEWEVRDVGVVIRPCPELIRINRRPTFTETAILFALADMRLERGQPFLPQVRAQTGIKELELVWQTGDAKAQAEALAAADARIPCNGMQYLHRLCQGRGWTWYLEGSDITIVTEEMQAARQLSRPISVEYRSKPLLTVLQDLARRADLRLKMAPGALATVSAQTSQSVTLLMAETTVDEAFQGLSGATGLTFVTDGLSIRVEGASATAPAPSPGRRQGSSVIIGVPVTVDGATYVVIRRPEELPEELVEKIIKATPGRPITLRAPGAATGADAPPAVAPAGSATPPAAGP